jgi:hypothetical protein
LFARALGDGFARLPAAVRAGHLVDERLVLAGRASVTGAASRGARLVARLFGLPTTAADVPVAVEMRADRDGEIWTRSFGGRAFRSRLAPGRRRGRVRERFGPFTFDLALTARADGLDLEVVGGRFGPLPLPRPLVPVSRARERVDAQGRFCFDIPVTLPAVGLLVHYRGWLVPKT